MRFLTLTNVQAAALALLSAGIIISLYFLKHRRLQFIVSSTQLWHRVVEHSRENSIFEKLRRLLSMLLAVTLGLLIVFAIARPEIEFLTGRPRRIVLTLDTSLTMETNTADGKTRWQRAVELAQELIKDEAFSTQFRITGTSGQYDSPFLSDRVELRRILERMRPQPGPYRFVEMEGVPAVLITDGVVPYVLPSGPTSLSVFESAPNIGITAFEVRNVPTAPLVYDAYLEIGNFGKESREVEVTMTGVNDHRITRKVRIGPGDTFKENFDISQFNGGEVRAEIHSDHDAFAPDDVAFAYLPVKRRARTLLVTPGNAFLETVLKAHPLVELSVVAPSDYRSADDVDAVIFDRFTPPSLPSRPAVIVGTPNATAVEVSFEAWSEDHALIHGLALHDVEVHRVSKAIPAGMTVIASGTNGTPLIAASESPKRVLLTFDLQSSDFPYHDAFPVFIDNALAWFDRDRLALRRGVGIVSVPFAAGEVRRADGSVISSTTHNDETFFEASSPGIYVVKTDAAEQYVAVNTASRQYSDINNSHVRADRPQRPALSVIRHEAWFYVLCVALVLLALEWFTYHKRITV